MIKHEIMYFKLKNRGNSVVSEYDLASQICKYIHFNMVEGRQQ